MKNADWAVLIPELSQWNDGQGISPRHWIAGIGTYEHAIGYAQIFWPEFIEHDGCVLFADFSEDSYRGFLRQTHGNRKAVEAVMNHRHIVDLFPNAEKTREQVLYLGRLIREIWECKLRRDFPDRKIIVSFAEAPDVDLLDCEVTFFQEGKGA